MGGFAAQDPALALDQRLEEMKVRSQPLQKNVPEGVYWLRIAPEGNRLLGDLQLQNLSKEFNELKHKIMPCEGIATFE